MKEKKIRGLLTVGLAAVLLLALAPGAAGHSGNHGTIKIHDGADADPDMRNEPHVSCDFWVEGFNMDGASGELVFYEWAPGGDQGEVTPTGDDLTWTGTPEDDGDGYHFLSGPYQLPEGHYRVEAFSTDGHPGDHGHFAKSKTFWVEPCEVVVGEECPEVALLAIPNQDGSITVDVETTGNFTLMRDDGTNTTVIGTFDGETTYVDTDTMNGVTYTYTVLVDEEVCAEVVVTAIPVFPTLLATGLAVGLGALAFVGLRRK